VGHTFSRSALAVALALVCAGTMASSPTTPQLKISLDEIAAGKAMGSKNAPIRLEDFTDFECPACKYLFEHTMKTVREDYVSTGKVYLIHHDFPLAMHKYSKEAAHWADAAAAIGKFEPVASALYAQQETWGVSGNIEATVAGVLSPAELKKVKALVNTPEIEDAVQRDITLGNQRGVNQTPSMFVTQNGKVIPLPPGPTPYPLLKQYLDYLLKP
jgi:protein-disulfide isomerase